MLKPLHHSKQSVDILTKISRIYQAFLNPMEVVLDIGTSKTRIAIASKGIVLREATYIGVNTKNGEYIFFGDEAYKMYGKTPQFIDIIKPIRFSILSDFDACVSLVDHFLKKAVFPYYKEHSLIKAGLIGYTSVSASATEVEQKAVKEALRKNGFTKVYTIEKSFCAAASIYSTIFSNHPLFVIDMGAGTIEMAVITMGGIVCSKTIKTAGEYFDKQIAHYINLKYGLIVGDLTVEEIKNVALNFNDKHEHISIRGKALENGLPKALKISSNDVREATAVGFNLLADAIKEMIELVPPDIVDSVVKNGIVLTGNLAVLEGLPEYLSKDINIPVTLSPSPENATIHGLLKLVRNKEMKEKIFF